MKEIFYTLQGEGLHAGRPAVLCRFSGCNLWSGREADREKSICSFCDTDFVGVDGPGGGTFQDPGQLAAAVAAMFPGTGSARVRPLVVCTGGEPLLQLDSALVRSFHELGLEVAIETNGTCPAPDDIDWICVSPKGDAELALKSGHELKLLFPQEKAMPDSFESLQFQYFFLQPIDGQDLDMHTAQAIEYCLNHPQWRLSLQIHKLIGIR